MDIVTALKQYKAYNEQEEHDKEVMLHLLETMPDIFERENETAHFTASSWLLNKEHDKVLLIYHNIYHSWSWTGGHADGEKDLLTVAKREAMEETGVTDIRAITDDIFSIEILTVDGHIKRGSYVPSHLHLNVTYLLEADEKEVGTTSHHCSHPVLCEALPPHLPPEDMSHSDADAMAHSFLS